MPARPPSTVGHEPRILEAALGLFAEQGYHGTTIREIARESGLSVPGVYHHYRSKQDLLVDLMVTVMNELLQRTRAAVDAAPARPSDQFDALVSELVRFHAAHRDEAFVASTELRSLEPESRERVVAMRDEQQSMLESCIRAGRRVGVFSASDPRDAARAVSVLCVGVASWFQPEGGASVATIVRRQLEFCRHLVGAT